MKKNIILIYIYTFLSTFILFYAVDTLFYLERGISSSGYILFTVISCFVQMILEIPCGVIADKYDKKKILILSNSLFIISIIIFILSKNYLLFVIATIINTIDRSLVTGISNTIIYESLENRNDFNKCLFYKTSSYNISYMIAMIIGGYLGQHISLVSTYYFTLIPMFLNFIIIFLLKNINVKNEEHCNYNNIYIFKNAITEINKSYIIRSSIITGAVLFSILFIVEQSHPDYAVNIGINAFGVGLYTAVLLIFSIIGSYVGSKIESKYHRTLLLINPIIIGLFILLIGILNNKLSILFLLLIYIFSESYDNIMFSKVHHNISSKSRVTVESVVSMLQSFCGIVFGIAITVILRYLEVYQSYYILGILIMVYGFMNVVFSYKKIN